MKKFLYVTFAAMILLVMASASWGAISLVPSDPRFEADVGTELSPLAAIRAGGGRSSSGSVVLAVYTWSVVSGTLPPGLFLACNSSSNVMPRIEKFTGSYCHFGGTPTTSGSYQFTLQAKDGAGNTSTVEVRITVFGSGGNNNNTDGNVSGSGGGSGGGCNFGFAGLSLIILAAVVVKK